MMHTEQQNSIIAMETKSSSLSSAVMVQPSEQQLQTNDSAMEKQTITLTSDHLILPHKQPLNSRRLLQTTSTTTEVSTITEQQVQTLLQQLSSSPRAGVMPPIDYKVDVPYTLASIYGVENRFYLLLDVEAVGRFDASATKQQVNDEFMRRIMANQASVCKECSGIYPAFSNMEPPLPSSPSQQQQQLRRRMMRRRNLLQQATAPSNLLDFTGKVSVLLVYDNPPTGGGSYSIYFSDVSRSVLAPSYTTAWAGSSDPASIREFIDRMKSNQFVVTTLTGSNNVKIDLVQSGIIIRTPPPATPPPPPAPPSASPTPKPDEKDYAMDMTVFGVYDRSMIPQDGEFVSPKKSDASSTHRHFDPTIATIFMAASLLLFWA